MRGCVRLGCRDAAVAGVALDPAHQRVWIADLPADDPLYIGLCHAHADRLTVPVGWSLLDERSAQAALFEVASPRRVQQPEATVSHLSLRPRKAAPVEPQLIELQLFETEPVEPAASAARDIAAGETVETAALGTDPVPTSWIGDPGARQHRMLDIDAESPLLSRAFRASRAAS
jgi:hypothetical protein